MTNENTLENSPVLAECYDELCDILTRVNDKALMKEIFECLCSPAERKDFAERWLLVKEIDKGVPQRKIAKDYCMSLCKITRGSKELKKEDSAFRKMLDMVK